MKEKLKPKAFHHVSETEKSLSSHSSSWPLLVTSDKDFVLLALPPPTSERDTCWEKVRGREDKLQCSPSRFGEINTIQLRRKREQEMAAMSAGRRSLNPPLSCWYFENRNMWHFWGFTWAITDTAKAPECSSKPTRMPHKSHDNDWA